MLAETAGAADVVAEGQEELRGAAEQGSEGGGQRPGEQHSEPIGDRVTSILGLMDLPEDVLDEALGKGKEEGKGKKEEVKEEQEKEQEEKPQGKGKAKSDEEDELTEEQVSNLSPEAKKLLERVHKKTAQLAREREEKATEKAQREKLEKKVQELEERATATPVMAPTPQNPLAHLQTPGQLNAAEAGLEHCMSWTRRNPDGGLYVGLGKKQEEGVEISPDQVPALQDEIEHTLRKALPEQRDHLKARVQQEAIARQDYPDLFDEDAEDHKLARLVIEQMPDLLRFPDAMLNVGIYVEGLKAYRARKLAAIEKANGKEKEPKNPAVAAFTRPQPKRAPALPKVQRPATEPARPDQDVEDAEKRAVESGGRGEAMTDLVRSLRGSQRNTRGGQRLVA